MAQARGEASTSSNAVRLAVRYLYILLLLKMSSIRCLTLHVTRNLVCPAILNLFESKDWFRCDPHLADDYMEVMHNEVHDVVLRIYTRVSFVILVL